MRCGPRWCPRPQQARPLKRSHCHGMGWNVRCCVPFLGGRNVRKNCPYRHLLSPRHITRVTSILMQTPLGNYRCPPGRKDLHQALNRDKSVGLRAGPVHARKVPAASFEITQLSPQLGFPCSVVSVSVHRYLTFLSPGSRDETTNLVSYFIQALTNFAPPQSRI